MDRGAPDESESDLRTGLVRAVLAARVADGHRREIGESQLWTMHADPPSIPVIEGTLPVQWANFPLSDHIPDTAKNDPFFADLSEDAPIVYLNSAFEGLPELLSDDENRPNAELALREADTVGSAHRCGSGCSTSPAAASS